MVFILKLAYNDFMANLIDINDLYVEYETQKELLKPAKKIYALNGVSLNIHKGEVLAIAGESGCGKSTLSKSLLELVPVKSGEILYKGKDLSKMNRKNKKSYYQNVSMVFQNPYASLNPKMTIFDIVKEPLMVNSTLRNFSPDLKMIKELKRNELENIVVSILEKVGMDKTALNKYPHEFSGGQRQRIAIAKSLILKPEFIIADEPVSALDVSIQAQIINLLLSLKKEYNLTFLFISHDLSVIKYISDRVAIMYLGKIVEIGKTEEVFEHTKHPYTKALLSSVPKLNALKLDENKPLMGDLPEPSIKQVGCPFASRCSYCMEKCKEQMPNETIFTETHKTSCFLYEN